MALLIGLQLVSGSPTSGFVTTIKLSVFSLVALLCIVGGFRFYVFSANSAFERSTSMALIIAYAGFETVSVEGNLLPAVWMPFVCIFCYTLHPKHTARSLAFLVLICLFLAWTHPTALDKALWARYLVATVLTIVYMEFVIAIFSSMQAQNQALSQARQLFLESISHELKTPLNGAMGAFEAIKAGSTDPKT